MNTIITYFPQLSTFEFFANGESFQIEAETAEDAKALAFFKIESDELVGGQSKFFWKKEIEPNGFVLWLNGEE